jgi:hypothetical protein
VRLYYMLSPVACIVGLSHFESLELSACLSSSANATAFWG